MPDSSSPSPERSPEDASTSASRPERAGGFTLDLSSGEAKRQPETWRRKRKTASPVMTKIVDLSTPTDAPNPEKPASVPKAEKPAEKKQGARSKRHSSEASGNALADLLDPETLARLRGGD